MTDRIAEGVVSLIDGWCDRRDLRSLRLILDGWPMVSGLTDDWAQLMEALRALRAEGDRLPRDEQQLIAELLVEVEAAVYRT